ncbi:uncharacterized protein LOC142235846 [Haematobia irritans]|uniref:uncharacterized protein LOC142235846 n=1 Tax=Haematobia irritans TaxID=7368 RepID=UPI003F501D72
MSGMRTKSQDIFFNTSQCIYDVIVLVETWLNSDFHDEEFFDARLFQVFRKDRDTMSTNNMRGGGVLVAVRRGIAAMRVNLPNDNSLLDQLCITISGQSNLTVVVSYIPPTSSYTVYNEHIQNVKQIAEECHQNELAIFGDFNLNTLLSINLCQINGFVNSLNRILDLIFISSNLQFDISKCEMPLSMPDMHHVALEIDFEFIMFRKISSSYCNYFYPDNCNFEILNQELLDYNWADAFNDKSVDDCYFYFVNKIQMHTNKYLRASNGKVHKLPWYTPGLKKLKNLRNKFYKLFKNYKDNVNYERYKYYSREFDYLNKFLYKQYLLDFQNRIKDNPKSFWQYIDSKKSFSEYPSSMHLGDIIVNDSVDLANLFATFFASNFNEEVHYDDSTSYLDLVDDCLDFGFIQINESDILDAIASLKASRKFDVDGLSAFLLQKLAISVCLPLRLIFNKSLQSGLFIDHDLKLFKCVNSLLDAIHLQCDLNSIVNWCEINHLSLNVRKCFYVCFSRRHSPMISEYYVTDNRVRQVSEILDLGIFFDSKLSFNAHIDYIMPKAYALLALIRRHSTEFQDPYVRKTLYTALVRTKLEYAQIVWSPSCSTHINRIERLQKKFVKFCLSSLNFTEPIPLYEHRSDFSLKDQ